MIALELFPCSGGMAEGFRRAGVTFTWAFDKDPNACDSYEKNLGHRPVEMDVRDLVRLAVSGWAAGPIDLLVADPPCTPWSRAGKRLGVEDERDMLRETAELIRILRPRAYLIGNVPGLDDSTQWPHLQAALSPLQRAGYCIADFTSLDAADFGVPQHRVRPFWFGHMAGPCLRWPLPTHGPSDHPALPGLELRPWVTCREALQHLPLTELGRRVRLRYRAAAATTEAQRKKAGKKARASRLDEPGETIRAKADAPLDLRSPKHPACEPDGLAPTIRGGGDGHSAPQVVMASLRHPPAQPAQPAQPARTLGAKDRGQSTVLEWPWAEPATTLACDPRTPPRTPPGDRLHPEPAQRCCPLRARRGHPAGLPRGLVLRGRDQGRALEPARPSHAAGAGRGRGPVGGRADGCQRQGGRMSSLSEKLSPAHPHPGRPRRTLNSRSKTKE